MSISHRTNRLKLVGTPAVEQLQNGRYQLTVNCTTINRREDWYSANKARIFPDFGSLESAEMSIDGLAPRTGEAYADMRLVSVQSSTQGELYIVTLVYQTLGASFVQVKDDTFNYVENGLRRVTRKSIAQAGTDFQKTIGTTSITSQIDGETAVTCILANYEVNDTDSYREVTEVYIQAGTLSETEDKVGSQLSIVKETFASTPATPSGYSIANETESNVDGILTRRFTFLKNNVQLSRSVDNQSPLKTETREYFNPESSRETLTNYSLINKVESNVDGIPTERYVFAKDNQQISKSVDNESPLKTETREYFKPDSSKETLTGYSLVNKQESNVDGIPTERYTFAKNDVTLSTSEEKVGSQLAIVKEVFNGTPSTPSGYSIADESVSNVNGIVTRRFRFLKENVQLSKSVDNQSALKTEVREYFKPDSSKATLTDYSLVNKQESNVDGIPTERYTFAKNNAVLSETEDKVGSQLAIVKEVFNGTPSTPFGYSIANEQVSNVDGIQTRRFTFLKNNVVLSESEDKVGGQLAIVKEVFNGTPSTPSGYSIASEQESNVDGIATKRFTFLKPNILSVSQNFNDGKGRVSVQAFSKTSAEVTTALSEVTSDHKLISQRESDFSGIKTSTFEYQLDESFIQDRELNGLNRIRLIELSDSDFSAQTIGAVSSTAPTSGLFLGSQFIDNGGTIKLRESIWLEAGISNATREFKRDGILYVTFYSQGSKFTPTALNPAKTLTDIVTEAFQGGSAAPVLTSKVEDVNGYRKFEVTVMLFQDGSSLLTDGTDNLVQSYQKYEKYERPGTFTLATDSITSSPGNTRDVLVNVTELISTDSNLAASYQPFSVTNWVNYNYRYVPSSTGQVVVKTGAADGYLGGGSFAASGGQVFSVDVDVAVGAAGSTPTPAQFNALSNQVISSSVEPAFTTDEGVKWYRKIKVQMVGTMQANLGAV